MNITLTTTEGSIGENVRWTGERKPKTSSLVIIFDSCYQISDYREFMEVVLNQRIFLITRNLQSNASVNSSCAVPPPGNCRAFARLASPGGGALANYLARPRGRALANPGGTPEKFVEVFKGMFS